MPPPTMSRMRLFCTSSHSAAASSSFRLQVRIQCAKRKEKSWIPAFAGMTPCGDLSHRTLTDTSRAMTRNNVSGQQSKEQGERDGRERQRADPDADAAHAVLAALRLGQALDGVVVEAHALLGHGGEGVCRALGLPEQLRD